MAKRGVATGAKIGARRALSFSNQPSRWGASMACSDGSAPMVCARMLCTRLRGGSASSSPLSQCMPARASATMRAAGGAGLLVGLERGQPGPCRVPSSASARRASTLRRTAFRIGFRLPLTCLLICTLQKPCQFRSSPIYATLHSSLGDIEDFGNVLVVHILQIPQDNRLPQLGREPPQGLVHHLLGLLAANPGSRGWPLCLPAGLPASEPSSWFPGVASSESVTRSYFPLRKWSTSRFRVTVVTHVMNDARVVSNVLKRAIHLDEHFLGQVRRVIWRAGKPVADVVNPSVVLLNDFLPCRSVAGHTATDKGIDGLVVVQSALPKGVTPGPNPVNN